MMDPAEYVMVHGQFLFGGRTSIPNPKDGLRDSPDDCRGIPGFGQDYIVCTSDKKYCPYFGREKHEFNGTKKNLCEHPYMKLVMINRNKRNDPIRALDSLFD